MIRLKDKSVSLRELPVGTACVSEIDVADGIAYPQVYIVREKTGSRIFVTQVNSLTSETKIRDLPLEMKVYPQDEN